MTALKLLAASSLLAATAFATPAFAVVKPVKSAFDGAWSVLIVTQKGECDRAYRYPVQIMNGVVGYAGQASFTIAGKVAETGAIVVKVSRGNQSALGTGKLAATGGTGTWKAGACAGTWTAEKR